MTASSTRADVRVNREGFEMRSNKSNDISPYRHHPEWPKPVQSSRRQRASGAWLSDRRQGRGVADKLLELEQNPVSANWGRKVITLDTTRHFAASDSLL